MEQRTGSLMDHVHLRTRVCTAVLQYPTTTACINMTNHERSFSAQLQVLFYTNTDCCGTRQGDSLEQCWHLFNRHVPMCDTSIEAPAPHDRSTLPLFLHYFPPDEISLRCAVWVLGGAMCPSDCRTRWAILLITPLARKHNATVICVTPQKYHNEAYCPGGS